MGTVKLVNFDAIALWLIAVIVVMGSAVAGSIYLQQRGEACIVCLRINTPVECKSFCKGF